MRLPEPTVEARACRRGSCSNEENVDQVETPVVETSVSAAKQYYQQEKHGLMVALEQSYVGAEEQLSENESKVDTFLINLKKNKKFIMMI